MRINGLERNEVPVGAVSQDSGVVMPSRPHEQLRVQAFRRVLLIVKANSQLSVAFDAARNLVDQATGEIVVLKAASENRRTLNVAERPDRHIGDSKTLTRCRFDRRASRSNSVAARIDFLILGATDYRHRATRMSQ
jgi:hypothetical protein